MRRIAYLLFLALGLAVPTGCYTPQSTCGFRFEVLKPPVLQSPVAVGETSPSLMIAPIASGPAALPAPARAAYAVPPDCSSAVQGSSPVLASRNDCTLDIVCQRLDQLERRLNATAAPSPIPHALPMGPP